LKQPDPGQINARGERPGPGLFTPLLGCALAAVLGLLGHAGPARADGPTAALDVPSMSPAGADVVGDPAPIWEWRDRRLQGRVDESMRRLELKAPIRRKQVGLALVDITDPERPLMAAVNGDRMMYAASLPKIAILLAVFQKEDDGEIEITARTEERLTAMIRRSSNSAATEMIHLVGKKYIADVLRSPRYRLYDTERAGGLWVGKDYAKRGLWQRDPINNLSHGASAIQVARFYYMMQTGRLVSPDASRKMKGILSNTALEHKFVRVLRRINPAAALFRKSGSWSHYHSDSVLVERDGRAYIAVALTDGESGQTWLAQIIQELDRIIFRS